MASAGYPIILDLETPHTYATWILFDKIIILSMDFDMD